MGGIRFLFYGATSAINRHKLLKNIYQLVFAGYVQFFAVP
jgi:hypothetical protein